MKDRPEPELQRLTPDAAPATRSAGALATKVVIAAAALLGTGYLASAHFSGDSISGGSKAPALPAAATAPPASGQGQHAGVELAMIAPEKAAQALRASHFSATQQADILAAVKRRDMRLVNMPVADLVGLAGQAVSISSAGIAQTVTLTAKPQNVLLPIRDIGEIEIAPITAPRPGGVQIVALTALGPEALPTLTSLDERLILDVIVQ